MKKDETVRLAERMRAMRRKFGETQLEFASRFGVYWQTYARWERWGPPNTVPHKLFVNNRLSKLANDRQKAKINVPAE